MGGRIVNDRKMVYDVIFKVDPLTIKEISLIRSGATLISALQPGHKSIDFFKAHQDKEIIGLAYEFIKDKVGELPIVRSMSEISGSSVILIAAELLSKTNSGSGVILGGVTGLAPTKVVII